MESSIPYAYCYCEENVYVCLEKIRNCPDLFDLSFAVFMSSFHCKPSLQKKNCWTSTVPYRSFKLADAESDLVGWDYHVIAVVRCKANRSWFVIDRDSSLPCTKDIAAKEWRVHCVDLKLYCEKTLFLEFELPVSYRNNVSALLDAVRYRIIPGSLYLCYFRSDRTHMMDVNGKYNKEPPMWAPVQNFPLWANTAERETVQKMLTSSGKLYSTSNLTCLINMDNPFAPGTVIDRHLFVPFFEQQKK